MKKELSLSNETLQQTIKIMEKVTSLLGTISHTPPEWEEVMPILSVTSSGTAGIAAAGSAVAMAKGAAVAGAGAGVTIGAIAGLPLALPILGAAAAVKTVKANRKTSQMDSKVMGIILLLKDQCNDAEKYKGMNYRMIDSKGQSLLNAIVNNTTSLISLLN